MTTATKLSYKNLSYYTSKTSTCSRCGGSGKIDVFAHVLGGRCFKCGGSGKTTKETFKKLPEPIYKVHYVKDGNSKTELRRSVALFKVCLDNQGIEYRVTKITHYTHWLVERLINDYHHIDFFANLIPF